MTTVQQPLRDPERRTLLNPHPVADRWMVGGILGTTGGALKWFVEQFCSDLTGPDRYRIIDAEAERAGVGARGLVCLTGLAGERAPWWNPAARGVLVGLDLTHGRGEIARAILEGVALTIRHLAEILVEMGAEVRRIREVGGGAASDLWNQIRADATGLPVERPRLVEGTATGIALLAGLGVGLYPDLATAARTIAPTDRVYSPNPRCREAYDRLAALQREVYASLRDRLAALAEFRWPAAAEHGSRGADPSPLCF